MFVPVQSVDGQSRSIRISTVASDGKEPGSFGYSYSQLVEIYAAANATKSNLMINWWTPEAMYSTYLGTEAEMQRVVLPSPTQECIDHRIETIDRCEFDDPLTPFDKQIKQTATIKETRTKLFR